MKSLCSFEPHIGRICDIKFLSKDNVDIYCVTSGSEGKTKVWNCAHLLHSEVEVKKPLWTYNTSNDMVTSLASLGSFMSMPLFAMGTATGQIRLVTVTPCAKNTDLLIRAWKVDSSSPVLQIEHLAETNILATLSAYSAKVFQYSIRDEEVKEDLCLDLNSDELFKLCGSTQPSSIYWAYPSCNLLVGLEDAKRIDAYDLETKNIVTKMQVKELKNRGLGESFPAK